MSSSESRSTGLIWVAVDNRIAGNDLTWLAWSLTVFAGVTMVTNFRFYSGKDINLRRSVPFIVVILRALALALVALDPPIVLFLLFLGYGLSGYIDWVWRRFLKPEVQPSPGGQD